MIGLPFLVITTQMPPLRSAGKTLLSLIALALNLDDKFFENIGALDKPSAFLHLLHYPGVDKFASPHIQS